MTPELTSLALIGLLHAALFSAMAVSSNRALPLRQTLGPRDTPLETDLSGKTARIYRTLRNNTENLGFFTAAVAVVELSDSNTTVTAALAVIYVMARVLYVPAYVFGWVPWRSVFFCIGFLATTFMFLAALL
ncbi:MAG: MAPEG family protein [Pseudoruegeria sp.]